MNLYIISFGQTSSEVESSVVLANSIGEAESYLPQIMGVPDGDDEWSTRQRENTMFVKVDSEPAGYYTINEGKTSVHEYTVKQVMLTKGIVYSGHYCC